MMISFANPSGYPGLAAANWVDVINARGQERLLKGCAAMSTGALRRAARKWISLPGTELGALAMSLLSPQRGKDPKVLSRACKARTLHHHPGASLWLRPCCVPWC